MPHRPIFFCHIPKTAGTSLRTAFERAFGPDEIVPQVAQIRQNGGLYPSVEAVVATLASNPVPVRLLRGHYHYSLHEALDEPIKIVVLREPVARTISALKHMLSLGYSSRETIFESLEQGTLPVPDNHMTRFLSGSLRGPDGILNQESQRALFRDPIDNPEERLSEAKENLKGIDILGITERMELMEPALAEFGAKLPVLRVNASKISDFDMSERHIETIRSWNKLDILLYDAAMQRLGLER